MACSDHCVERAHRDGLWPLDAVRAQGLHFEHVPRPQPAPMGRDPLPARGAFFMFLNVALASMSAAQ
eukprot:9167452-Lingulodinium_polyedra.AAC.1